MRVVGVRRVKAAVVRILHARIKAMRVMLGGGVNGEMPVSVQSLRLRLRLRPPLHLGLRLSRCHVFS